MGVPLNHSSILIEFSVLNHPGVTPFMETPNWWICLQGKFMVWGRVWGSPSSDIKESAPAILLCRSTKSTSLVHEFGAVLIDTSNEG